MCVHVFVRLNFFRGYLRTYNKILLIVTERVMGTAGQLTTNLGFSEPASVDTKMCMSRGRFVRRLSNQSDVILPGHVTTAQRCVNE